MTRLQNDLFLRACKREPIERTPIWIMRQAGRYLPEYRAVRAKSDFLTMCKTPDLVAEVTLQPIDIIKTDAAILFSDILVIPEAMGMHLEMHEGRGPIFPEPIRNEDDFKKLKTIDPFVELKYVMDSIKVTKDELDGRVPLIGFSGSPWTLLTYMVEGSGSKTFARVKELIYNNPKLAHQLLDKIADTVADYLNAKIESGVNAVQIFDTWGGILTPSDFNEFSLDYMTKIISKLNKENIPVIMFAKGVHHSIDKMADCGANVLGLDWTMDLGKMREQVGHKVALQGNMDPTILYGSKVRIKTEVQSVLKSFGEGSGHIFNLGHGILPDIKPDHAKALVQFVKEESVVYHK
ncbi:MAG: uroporphyrinogen decarboxylase [Bacteroidetes bacterium]|nr:uroporphyrinogen decarboxylase [Bacteroidota bacterium]